MTEQPSAKRRPWEWLDSEPTTARERRLAGLSRQALARARQAAAQRRQAQTGANRRTRGLP